MRRALSLPDPDSELTIPTVEELRPEDEAGQYQRNWDGVDCGLYYGAATAKDLPPDRNETTVYLLRHPNCLLLAALKDHADLEKRVFSALQRFTPAPPVSEGRVYGGGLH